MEIPSFASGFYKYSDGFPDEIRKHRILNNSSTIVVMSSNVMFDATRRRVAPNISDAEWSSSRRAQERQGAEWFARQGRAKGIQSEGDV